MKKITNITYQPSVPKNRNGGADAPSGEEAEWWPHSFLLIPRVSGVVALPHMFNRDVRVDLGRREAFVAEQLLDGDEVGAVLQEMRRE